MEDYENNVLEAEVVKQGKSLRDFWDNASEEEKALVQQKAAIARHENAQERREIQKAAEKIMNKQYRFKDVYGHIVTGSGYEARANAMFKEVVNRGKNMVSADKQLQSYLGEDQPITQNNNNILVVFSNKEIDI